MKKIICMLVLTSFLFGCSSIDSSESAFENTSQTEVEAELENNENTCNWESNSVNYSTIDEFLSEGADKLKYYNTVNEEEESVEPYIIDFDTNVYDMTNIRCVENTECTFYLTNKETREKVRFSFFYEYQISSVDNVTNSENLDRTTIDYQGQSGVQALEEKTEEYHKLILVPDENCKMTVTYTSDNSEAAATAQADFTENRAIAILDDFTISKA